MAAINVIAVICLVPAIVGTQAAHAKCDVAQEALDSPSLQSLARRLVGDRAEDRATAVKFWSGRKTLGPLVEPIADDPHSSWVTFLWLGDGETRSVNVQGGPASADSANWMKVLGGTSLWYRTERIPNDARFIYFFQVNRPREFPRGADLKGPLVPARPDPLNPRTTPTRDGSVMELPKAPPQPWLKETFTGAWGTLSDHSINSEILNQDREFTIYTPAGFDPQKQDYGLLVLFDGDDCRRSDQIPGPVILDNLILLQKIPPLVVVFVQQIERGTELACSKPFADFVASELVPWVRKHRGVSQDPSRTIVGGMSMGGLMAAYCGLRHSEVFGNVLSLSGAFGWSPGSDGNRQDSSPEPGWLTRQFSSSRPLPLKFYLAPGVFEHRYPVSILAENRRMRDVLVAKEYEVSYDEFSGGHDYICWLNPFVDGLMKLAVDPSQK